MLPPLMHSFLGPTTGWIFPSLMKLLPNLPLGWFLPLPIYLLIHQLTEWLHLPHMHRSPIAPLEWLQPPLRNFLVSPHLCCLLQAPMRLLLDSQLGLLHLLCQDLYSHKKLLIFKC